jgi:hypothetical protein
MDRVTQLLDELYINGFAVMEDAIPIPTIERIHAEFLPMLEHVRHREHELGQDERGDIRVGCGRLQHPARVTMQWPWEGGSDAPRPELVICYSLRWAAPLMTRPLWVGEREFEQLSERGRKLFERATILPERAAA